MHRWHTDIWHVWVIITIHFHIHKQCHQHYAWKCTKTFQLICLQNNFTFSHDISYFHISPLSPFLFYFRKFSIYNVHSMIFLGYRFIPAATATWNNKKNIWKTKRILLLLIMFLILVWNCSRLRCSNDSLQHIGKTIKLSHSQNFSSSNGNTRAVEFLIPQSSYIIWVKFSTSILWHK